MAVLHVALKILKWLAIAGSALYLILRAVNFRDENLSSEEHALAASHGPIVPDDQNIYVAARGFNAPAGVDPIEFGARSIAEQNEAAAKDPWSRERLARLEANRPGGEGRGTLDWVEGGRKLLAPRQGSFLPEALAHAADVKFLMGANAELVARYALLQRLPSFRDTAAPDILSPSLWSNSHVLARSLLLWQCAIDAQSGRVERALDFLGADVALWRRVLAGSGTLLDEMAAIGHLEDELRLLSDLIASKEFDARARSDALRRMTAPLTKSELTFGRMFAREFELNAALLAGIDAEQGREASRSWYLHTVNSLFYSPFFKLNATLNRSAHAAATYQRLAGLAPREYLLARAEVEKETDAMADFGLGWVYNPIGKTLVAISAGQYLPYADRLPDLDAYLRLVRAQLEVRIASIPAEQVAAFLAAADPQMRNPYTNQPFEWKAADRSISFAALSERWRKWGTKAFVPLP